MKILNRLAIQVLLISVTVFSATSAFAFPLTSTKPWNPSASVEIFATSGFSYDSIVALSNCSGSLVKFKTAPTSALALVLTNGHCTGGGVFGGGMPNPGQVLYKKPQSFKMNLLRQDGSTLAGLRATQILYGTMTDTDVGLLELNQTYAQIEAATGVKPLTLTDVAPAPGTAIDIPSGYWKRTYSCSIEATVNTLKEGGYVFTNSLRYSPTGCEVIGGTSGSPIVSSATGEVIAINNTGNEDGARCTMNNPCEVDAAGTVTVIKGRGYGQQIATLSTCLTASGVFDLAVPGCVLPK
jgi:V8-like Glu-specific endopeptidase